MALAHGKIHIGYELCEVSAGGSLSESTLEELVLDFYFCLLRFGLGPGFWNSAPVPLSANPEIIMKSGAAFSNCHLVAPFRLQPPRAALLYHTRVELAFLFTLPISFF